MIASLTKRSTNIHDHTRLIRGSSFWGDLAHSSGRLLDVVSPRLSTRIISSGTEAPVLSSFFPAAAPEQHIAGASSIDTILFEAGPKRLTTIIAEAAAERARKREREDVDAPTRNENKRRRTKIDVIEAKMPSLNEQLEYQQNLKDGMKHIPDSAQKRKDMFKVDEEIRKLTHTITNFRAEKESLETAIAQYESNSRSPTGGA